MEFIMNGKVHGTMAQRILAANGDIGVLRMNGTLRKEEWKTFDEAIVAAARTRLVGVADLLSMGLVYGIPNGLGKMVLETERAGTIGEAEVSMSPLAKVKKDRQTFELLNLPLPVTMVDFGMELRVLLASRERGLPLDTSTGEEAGRSVAEKVENMLFNGSGLFTFGGGTIYGYTDHPDRNEFDLSGDWSDPGDVTTGEPIIQDILTGIQANHTAKHYGPYVLYVPTAYGVRLSDDYKANSDKSIIARILEMPQISGVKTADQLTAGNIVLAQMTQDVVRIVSGMDMTTVDWEGEGGYELNYKVITITVPQIRSDKNGNCGVAHGSEA